MPRIKRRTYAGGVCEQEVFTVPDRVKNLKAAEPIQRFKTEEERWKHKEGIAKRHHAGIVNATFSPQSLYSTLTMDNDHEVHTFEEARRVRDLFVRRLKYAVPDAQITIYIGRGKSTSRIHFHMLANGLTEVLIRDKWQAGSIVRIEPLRDHNYYNGVDYGRDYTGLANYLFDHWTPEQGGHHYKATKNMRQPERETPTVVKRAYSESKPPRAPKGYKLVECKSNQFGYLYFKYVRIPDATRPPTTKKPLMKC